MKTTEEITQVRSYEEAVDITVKWWSEKSFKTPLNQNNGDESANGGMMFALMNIVSSQAQNEVTPEKIQKFEDKLRELLLSMKDEAPYYRSCDVDYHPNEPLRLACEFSEVNSQCLPCKTFTKITKENKIEGRYQYGGDWFTI